MVSLGRNTFLPHTHQKASVLFLQKYEETGGADADYNIFFGISERDGKNSKGQFILRDRPPRSLWDQVDHDLGEIADHFNEFCRKEHLLEV